MSQVKAQAIQTALTGDWNNAILLNRSLLEENPNDIDTLNRLAFAYSSIGNVKEAKELYQQVLSLDSKNPIALRNLNRLGSSSSNGASATTIPAHLRNTFIEEPGKTKIIELLNIADKKVIAPLRCGEAVTLSIKRMKIFVLDQQKQYIGMLPDDISRRLTGFMNGGNEYEAYIKSVDNNSRVIIFVREVKRTQKFKDQPSFIYLDHAKLTLSRHGGKAKQERKADSHDNADEDNSSDNAE